MKIYFYAIFMTICLNVRVVQPTQISQREITEKATPLELQMIAEAINGKLINNLQKYLKKGADINAKDGNGNAALKWAAWYGNTNLAQALINAGAHVDIKDDAYNTPLEWATRFNNVLVIQLLISSGADVNTKNDEGNTPLLSAAQLNNTPVIKLLITAGAEVNVKNDEGNTPLILAARFNNGDIVKLLIAHGADDTVRNEKNRNRLSRDYAENVRIYDDAVNEGLAELKEHVAQKTGTKDSKKASKTQSEKSCCVIQ